MAVKKSISRTKSRLPSGIHQVASKAEAEVITPVPTKESRATKALRPYISTEVREVDDGTQEVEVIDVTAARQGGAKSSDLQIVGVTKDHIQQADDELAARKQFEDLKPDPSVVPTPTVEPAPEIPVTVQMKEREEQARKEMIQASITETGGGIRAGMGLTVGATTQNRIAQSEAIKKVNQAITEGEITRYQGDQVIAQIKKSVPNTKEWAKESKAVTKEVLLAQIPIYGTYRNWGQSPGWMNGVGVAADIATIIPVVGQTSGAVRAGAKVPTIVRSVAVAEVMGPIRAIKNPIAAAKSFVDPLEILVPKKIPLAAVSIKDNTIRIPGATAHVPSPFTIPIPKELLVDIGMGAKKTAVYLDDIPDLAARNRIAALMEARDTVTKAAVKGDDAKAIFNVGEGLAEVRVKSPPVQKVTGAAAAHSTDDLRGFILDDVVAAGSEGGLFVAEGGKSRFVRAPATGAKTLEEKLAIAKTKGYDSDPIQKVIDAVKTGQLPDKPMPGVLLIRDEKVLDTLRGSNKLWQGNAEIELIVPDGTVIPKVSQLIHTRLADGTRAHIAVVGKPFTPVELLKLKLVGSRETITGMFGRVGEVKAVKSAKVLEGEVLSIDGVPVSSQKASTSMTTAVKEGKKAESLTIAAKKAADAGDTTKAAQLTRQANEAADNSRRAADIAEQYAGSRLFARVRPTAIYTGDQDISAAFRAVDEGSKYLETDSGVVVRDRPSDSEYRQSRQELAAITTRGEIDVTSAVRIGVPNDVLLRGGVPAAAIRAAIDGLRTNPRTQDPVVVRPDRPNDIELPTRPAQEDLNRARERVADDLKNTPVPIPRDVFKPRMRPPGDGNGGGLRRPPGDGNGGGPRPPGDGNGGGPRPPDRNGDEIKKPPGPPRRPTIPNGDRPRVRPRDESRPNGAPPKYQLPGGKSLRPGEFPVEVTWPQGLFQITRNLLTGKTTWKRRTPDTTLPQEGFQVSRTGPTRPRKQILGMGQTDAIVSKDFISFKRSKTAKASKDFRRSRGRL